MSDPAQPHNLRTSARSTDSLTVQWDQDGLADYYTIRLVASKGDIITVNATDTDVTITGLTPGEIYTVTVTAFSNGLGGSESEEHQTATGQ